MYERILSRIGYAQATEEFLGKFTGSETYEHLLNQNFGGNVSMTTFGLIELQASGYINNCSRGGVAQRLSNWHSVVKEMCSIEFNNLGYQYPELSKPAINALERMQLLNGMRLGLKRAATKEYKNLERRASYGVR